ncbi:MAG: DUF898 family protein [Caldilineaceae bacterium SB0664_bin_27]|uniref:DUF898 family protein n=1 Tax=Caldilineaceae bacterium SB0664_bin_27 TaxID=2605260 RepID=A0A6B0YSL1_9CHLR|nr:DUF898 family protein [Caldilineaceae bacterium SB0664_bin_27]
MPTNLEFRGRWLNVYGNLILIAFLTGITLCIYVPWGYARWQRIVTESTYYEDQQLEFDGSGAEVLVQFILIGFFTLITLGLYVILGFAATRMLRWQYAHTLTPNGLRMEYEGNTIDIFWEWLLLVVFTPLTVGLYYYWGRNRLRSKILNNVSLSDQPMQFRTTAGDYFLAVLSNWLMTVVALVIYVALGFFLRREVLDTGPLFAQLESIGAGLPFMDLVNLLVLILILGVYALLGLALLGMAIVRFRAWEVNRTILPPPMRSRSPMPAVSTPLSALAGPPPPVSDVTPSGPEESESLYAENEPPPLADSGYVVDTPGRRPLPATQEEGEDEYYDFGEFSTHAGQELDSNSGDERSDWSSEQWARPQAAAPSTDENEDEEGGESAGTGR